MSQFLVLRDGFPLAIQIFLWLIELGKLPFAQQREKFPVSLSFLTQGEHQMRWKSPLTKPRVLCL